MFYIGSEVKERMDSLSLTAETLASKSFLELEDIKSIVNNEIALEDIDEYDFELMCSVLHCKPEFFKDPLVREKDLLVATMNRGNDNKKSIAVKIKIQDFMNDFIFVNEVLAEIR